jgi:hypothetical protein
LIAAIGYVKASSTTGINSTPDYLPTYAGAVYLY